MIDIAKLAEQAEIDIDEDFDIFGSTNGSLARFTALVLEAAAVECESRQDHEEQEKALKRFRDADKSGDERNAVDRGQHWMAVSTVNAVVRNCATAIRAMKPAKEQT